MIGLGCLSVNDSKIIPILALLDGISIKNTTAGSDITKCIFETKMFDELFYLF